MKKESVFHGKQTQKKLLAIVLASAMAVGTVHFTPTMQAEAAEAVSAEGLDLKTDAGISKLLGTTRTEKDFDGSFLSVAGYASMNGAVHDRSAYIGTESYVTASNETELLDAIDAAAQGNVKVIEITADMYLGWWELTEEQRAHKCIEAYTGLDSESAGPLTNPVLLESGVSELSISNVNGLTIFSQNGATMKHAEWKLQSSAQDVVIRNLRFCETWDWPDFIMKNGAPVGDTGKYKKNGWTNLKVNGAKNVWIDHCTFGISFDGNIDVENSAQGVSITWCDIGAEDDVYVIDADGKKILNPNSMLYRTMNYMEDLYKNDYDNCFVIYRSMRDAGITTEEWINWANYHSKCHLVGSGDKDAEANTKLQVTLAYNKYESIGQRIPLLRGGNGLLVNCYMTNVDHRTLKGTLDSKISKANTAIKKICSSAYVPNTLYRSSNPRCGASVAADTCVYEGVDAVVGNASVKDDGIDSAVLQDVLKYSSENNIAIVNSSVTNMGDQEYIGSSFDGNGGVNAFTKPYGFKYNSLSFKWTDTQGAKLPFNYQVMPLSQTKKTVEEYSGYGALQMSAEDWTKTTYASDYSIQKADENVAVTGLDASCETSLFVGERTQVKTVVAPVNAANKIITFESSDSAVAEVSESGMVKAKAAGYAKIKAKTQDGGFEVEIDIQVVNAVERIQMSDQQVRIKNVGGFTSLKATVYPENASDKNFTWSSSDESIVTVDSNGRVTAVAEGAATIYATSVQRPQIRAKCDIIVGNASFDSASAAVASYHFDGDDELEYKTTAGTVETPENDRSETAGKSLKLNSENATVSIENPFAGMDKLVEEPQYDNDGYPVWSTGVTISYWLKTTKTDSNLLTFKNESREIAHSSDAQYYEVCQAYNPETAEDPSDDFYMGTKSYYYGYAYVLNEEGKRTYNDDGTPVLDKSKRVEYTVYSDYGRFIIFNPNYPGMGYEILKAGETEDKDRDVIAYSLEDNTEVILRFLRDPVGYKKDGESIYQLYGKMYDPNDEIGKNSLIRYARVKGALKLTSACAFDFGEDDGASIQLNPNGGSYNSATQYQKENRLRYSVAEPATMKDTEWHFVTVVIKNDDVVSYVDGVKQEYPTLAAADKQCMWKDNTLGRAFNLGYGMGTEYSATRKPGLAPTGNRVDESEWRTACTIMEWLTDQGTTFELGGDGGSFYGTSQGGAAGANAVTIVSAGTELDDLSFYAVPMNASEVYALYQENLHGKVTSIELVSAPTADKVMQGESIDVAGGVIKAVYEDDYSENVNITNGMLSYADEPGEQTVTVNYQEQEVTFKIQVVSKAYKPVVEDIEITLVQGYEATSQAVRIIQRNNVDISIKSATVTGTNADKFVLNKTDGTTVAANSTNTEYIVSIASGLSTGTYTADVVFTYEGGFTVSGKLVCTVQPIVYELTCEMDTQKKLEVGYATADAAIVIPLTNTGNVPVQITGLSKRGSDSAKFTLNKTTGVIAVGATDTSFTLIPEEGLEEGSYNVAVTITYNRKTLATPMITVVVAKKATEPPATTTEPATTTTTTEPATTTTTTEPPAGSTTTEPATTTTTTEPATTTTTTEPATTTTTTEPATTTTTTEPAGEIDYVPGDVIGDDGLNMKDAQFVLKVALRIEKEANLTAKQKLAADVVDPAGIDMKDGQAILKRALRIPVVFKQEQTQAKTKLANLPAVFKNIIVIPEALKKL